MNLDRPVVVKNRVNAGGAVGSLWLIGWMFTIGYLHLPLTRALFAILLWPYDLGRSLSHV